MKHTNGLTEEQVQEVEFLVEQLEVNSNKVGTCKDLREILQVYKDCATVMEQILVFEDIVKEFELNNKGGEI